jgi:uncharacterized protein (TIGR03437 family)
VVARAIDLSSTGDQVYLSLFGTSLRNATGLTVRAGSQNPNATYFGPQGTFTGLDRVNIGPLPSSLVRGGRVTIVLTADGQTANPMEPAIR